MKGDISCVPHGWTLDGSRTEVDEMVRRAIAVGGRHAMEPQDHGFAYGWSFYDPDGHRWEVFWMNESATQQ
jgi:predicted lactoylglutathione lyase